MIKQRKSFETVSLRVFSFTLKRYEYGTLFDLHVNHLTDKETCHRVSAGKLNHETILILNRQKTLGFSGNMKREYSMLNCTV